MSIAWFRPADCRLTIPGGLRADRVLPAGARSQPGVSGKFAAGLRELHAAGKLGFHGGLVGLAALAAFAAML
jgi:hypothetical protein